MTTTHENCIPLDWLLALPARVRAAIINCELTLDDTSPPWASARSAGAPKFIPPSDAESPNAPLAPSPAGRTAAERVEQLTAACRIPEETILQYIRANWDSGCASLSSAPRAVLEEVVRAWPDILADITAPKWHRHPACDPRHIPARPHADTLQNRNNANPGGPRSGTGILPVTVATL